MSALIALTALTKFGAALDAIRAANGDAQAEELVNTLVDTTVSYTKKSAVLAYLEEKTTELKNATNKSSDRVGDKEAPVKEAPANEVPAKEKAVPTIKQAPAKEYRLKETPITVPTIFGPTPSESLKVTTSAKQLPVVPKAPVNNQSSYATAAKKPAAGPRALKPEEKKNHTALTCPDEIAKLLKQDIDCSPPAARYLFDTMIGAIVQIAGINSPLSAIVWGDEEPNSFQMYVTSPNALKSLGKKNNFYFVFGKLAIVRAANLQLEGGNPPYILAGYLMIVNAILEATNNTEYIPYVLRKNLGHAIAMADKTMEEYKETQNYLDNIDKYGDKDNTKGVFTLIRECAANIRKKFENEKAAFEQAHAQESH
jgi:hypothetical protein